MAFATKLYPLAAARSKQSPSELLLRECERLRHENERLRALGDAARAMAADIALNPFVEIDDLRPRAAALLARERASRMLE